MNNNHIPNNSSYYSKMEINKSTEQNKPCSTHTKKTGQKDVQGEVDFPLLPKLPHNFVLNYDVHQNQYSLPVFSFWVKEMLLMRKGSVQICLMAGKADFSIFSLESWLSIYCFSKGAPASFPQELAREPHVNPEMPRLISQQELLIPLPGI